jgi:phage shock protein C
MMYCYNCGKELEEEARYCSVCGTAKPTVQPPAAQPREQKPLTRIREGKKIAGVCGGVARYLEMDVTLVRVLWVVLTIFPPLPGIIVYIVCWIVMPQDPPALVTAHDLASTVSPQPIPR